MDRVEIITLHPYTLLAGVAGVGLIVVLGVAAVALLLRRHYRDADALHAAAHERVWAVANYIARLRNPATHGSFDDRFTRLVAEGHKVTITVDSDGVGGSNITVRVRHGKHVVGDYSGTVASLVIGQAETALGIVRQGLAPVPSVKVTCGRT